MNSFESYAYLVPAMGLIGLLYTLWKFSWVSKQDAGTDRMKEISNYIAEGAMAFLKAEWKILTYFGIIVALLLGFMGASDEKSHWFIAVAFLIGAFFSALAGYIGMRAATKANVRTAHAARTSLAKALNVPLVIRAHSSYMQSIEALDVAIDTDHPIEKELLSDQLKPAVLEQESISSFMVVPGFGSRKRVADTLGNLPEQLAAAFDGNVAILHFDK